MILELLHNIKSVRQSSNNSTSHTLANMSSTRVVIIGAAGETGQSIVNGLLEAGNFVGDH